MQVCKTKFAGARWADRLYIRGFLIAQPMVSPAGWAAYHVLPDAACVALLAGNAPEWHVFCMGGVAAGGGVTGGVAAGGATGGVAAGGAT